MKQQFLLLVGIGCLSFIVRLLFSLAAPKELLFDSLGYQQLAMNIEQGTEFVECCNHNAGYTLFLAGIFRLVGDSNVPVVIFIQMCMDAVAAILIYRISIEFFSPKAAFIAAMLYALNPFTSAYTGVLLAESLTLFLVVVLAYVISRSSYRTESRYWFWSGLLIGLLLFVKISYSSFIILFIGIMIWFVNKGMRVLFVFLTGVGFLLASGYSLIGYYRAYEKLSLVPPYSWGAAGMYLGYYTDRRYPELVSEFPNFHPEYSRVVEEYYRTPLPEKLAFTTGYAKQFRQLFWSHPGTFVYRYIQNGIWMWDKRFLYPHIDPFYPADRGVLRSLNIALFVFFLIGLGRYVFLQKWNIFQQPFFLFTLLLFFYISVLFPLAANETRHSISFYPLLLLWAGYGMSYLFKKSFI